MSVRRHGFSLLELMIASSLLLIVVTYSLQSFAVNQKMYVVTDQVTESQQNLRAVAQVFEFDLRHAGMMVPEAAALCGIDSTSTPDVLYVSDSQAIDIGADRAIYEGAQIQNAITNVSAGAQTFSLDSLLVEPAPARPAYDTDGDAVPDSDFQSGAGVIVVDLQDEGRGVACGRVDDVNLGSSQIDVVITSAPLATSSGPTRLAALPAIEYRIDGARFLRNNVLMAKDVEDLQLAFFLDANDDNVLDAGELHGDGTGPDYQANAQSGAELREVRANLVLRTRSEDPNFSLGRPQPAENRGAGAASDGFRRRVHTSTVMLRNVSQRLASL